MSASGFALAQRPGAESGGLAASEAGSGRTETQQREEQAITLFDVFLLLDGTQKPQLKMMFDNAILEAQDSQSSQ